jgi:hypothetical protein
MSHMIVVGTIGKAESRTAKSGKPYWSAELRESLGAGNGNRFWKLVTLSETIGAALLELREGESAAFADRFDAKLFEFRGETRIEFTIFVEGILPAKPPKRTKTKEAAAPPTRPEKPASDRSPLDRHGCDGSDPFGDEIPF